jgi:predicted glycosyltransferase
MYCHDRFGLGHTSRTLAIASHLAENLANCSILVLTDLSIIGRFKFPQNVDYVHLPGIVHNADQRYYAGNLNIELENTYKIRRKITQSAARTFQPDLIVVERDPFGLQNEMQRTLSFIREELPQTKVIWGLPDVIGEPEMVVREWNREGVYEALNRFCDEIWVYGAREIFDLVREYQVPAPVAGKIFYSGYLRSPSVSSRRIHKDIARMDRRKPFVLITTGSGAEGFTLIDCYLRFLECAGGAVPFQTLIVTGPMMRSREKMRLMERARKLPEVIFHRFSKHILQYVKYADLVVSNGGFNTLCEILSYRKRAIFVPGMIPPHEHLLRARIFGRLGLVRFLSPIELTPDSIGETVTTSVSCNPELAPRIARADIPLDGLEKITERIKLLCGVPHLKSYRAAS